MNLAYKKTLSKSDRLVFHLIWILFCIIDNLLGIVLYLYSLTIWFVCIFDNLLGENKMCRADAQGDGCLIRRRKPFQRDLFAHSLDLFTHSYTSRFIHICTVTFSAEANLFRWIYMLLLFTAAGPSPNKQACISFPFSNTWPNCGPLLWRTMASNREARMREIWSLMN